MISILTGDSRVVLPTLPAKSVQTVVTSPPYFNCRNYGVEDMVWGGDPVHAHVFADHPSENGQFCACGAWLGSLGLETRVEKFAANLVEVFSHVHRVLRDDGVLWLNLAPSYSGSGKGAWSKVDPEKMAKVKESYKPLRSSNVRAGKPTPGYPAKAMIPVPHIVAMELSKAGWLLRSEIIWERPNQKPRPDRDRPTTSHESVFLFSKRPKYYYNHKAVLEPAADGKWRNLRSVWEIPTQPLKGKHTASFPETLAQRCLLLGSKEGDTVLDPFSGSGTVAVAASRLGRHAIGIDLNAEYNEQAQKRLLF